MKRLILVTLLLASIITLTGCATDGLYDHGSAQSQQPHQSCH